jgi:GNAT superfamily N-acetyltransferase
MSLDEKVQAVQASSEPVTRSAPAHPRYGTISVFDIQNTPLEWPNRLTRDPIQFRRIYSGEASVIQSAMEKSGIYIPHDASRRLAAGREGYVGEIMESPDRPVAVTYGWVALSAEPLGNTGCAFNPPPAEAYLYDFATVPDYRGRGFYPALLRFILANLAGQGVKRAWIGTEPGNDTSARSIKRAGFTKVADTTYLPGDSQHPPRFELKAVPDVSPELFKAAQLAHISP